MAAATITSTSLHLRSSHCGGIASSAVNVIRSPPLLRRRLRSLAVSAVQQDAVAAPAFAAVPKQASFWTTAPVSSIGPATADETFYSISVDLSNAPRLVASHTMPGQFLMLRIPGKEEFRPSFMNIVTPPGAGAGFEFLVKKVPNSTAEQLCKLQVGDLVDVGRVTGQGFPLHNIFPPEVAETVLIFAAGFGIGPVRSLIEFGFDAKERANVRLYYGARSARSMAFQDRFKDWEKTGVQVIPVMSRPDHSWQGEQGYVQDAFSKAKNIKNPDSTVAVISGSYEMTLEIIDILVKLGVPRHKLLTNYA